jgi:hypothetical protein
MCSSSVRNAASAAFHTGLLHITTPDFKTQLHPSVQNFISDLEGTSNSVDTCNLPDDGIDDSETFRSK